MKIEAVVLYILERMPEGVDYIHLFKTMYFAQQDHLVTYGLPIMNDTFAARKHGPIPKLTYKALQAAEGKRNEEYPDLKEFIGALDVTEISGHQIVKASGRAKCDYEELAESNIEILDKWIARCKDVEAFKLSSISHDKAWKSAKDKSDRTGEDINMTLYDIAEAGGATPDMLVVIRERQAMVCALK